MTNKTGKPKFLSTGISFPVEIISKIDKERGDIPRSKYITKLILQGKNVYDKTDNSYLIKNKSTDNQSGKI